MQNIYVQNCGPKSIKIMTYAEICKCHIIDAYLCLYIHIVTRNLETI